MRASRFYILLAISTFGLAVHADDELHKGFVLGETNDSSGENISGRTGGTLSLPRRGARGGAASTPSVKPAVRPVARGLASTQSGPYNAPAVSKSVSRGFNVPTGRGADNETRVWDYTGTTGGNGRIDAARSKTTAAYLGRVSQSTVTSNVTYGLADRAIDFGTGLQTSTSNLALTGYNKIASYFGAAQADQVPVAAKSNLRATAIDRTNSDVTAVTQAFGNLTAKTTQKTVESDGRIPGEKVLMTVVTPPDAKQMASSVRTLVEKMGSSGYDAALEAAKGDSRVTDLVTAMKGSSHQNFFNAVDATNALNKDDYAATGAKDDIASRRLGMVDVMQSFGARATGDSTVASMMADPSARMSSLISTFRMNPSAYETLMADGAAGKLKGEAVAVYQQLNTDKAREAWAASGKAAGEWQGERAKLYGTETSPKTPATSEEAYRALIGPAKGKGGVMGGSMTDYMGNRLNDKTPAGNREFDNMAHAMSSKVGDKQYLTFQDKTGKTRMMPLSENAETNRANFAAMTAAGMTLKDRYKTEPVLDKDGKEIGKKFSRNEKGEPIEDESHKNALAERKTLDESVASAKAKLEESRTALTALEKDLAARTSTDAAGNYTAVGDEGERYKVQLKVASAQTAVTTAEATFNDLEKKGRENSTPVPPATRAAKGPTGAKPPNG